MAPFRPITDDERARHQTIKDHVWGEGGVPDYDADAVPDALGERWAYVEDDQFRSICTLMEIDVRLADEWRPVGGIRGFVTPPEHRGQGYGRRLLRAALDEFADRDLAYTLLWPASIAYYRRHGWGLVDTSTEYAFPPDALVDPGVAGTFERVGVDDFDRLDAVWTDYASQYELAVRRSPEWWRERVLADRWVYCFTPDGGDEPDGYVVSTLDRDGKVMQIEELIYRTETARRQLLAFVGRHVPQADRVEWTCPEERRLLFEAADPDAVDLSTVPGASGRIVDVIEAIKALPPDRAPTDPVTVAVSDPLRSANDGVFRVDTALTCTRVETGDADIGEAVDPDLTVDVAVLSQLYVGSVSIRTAADRERLDATDDAVAALSSTFGTRDVSVTDFF